MLLRRRRTVLPSTHLSLCAVVLCCTVGWHPVSAVWVRIQLLNKNKEMPRQLRRRDGHGCDGPHGRACRRRLVRRRQVGTQQRCFRGAVGRPLQGDVFGARRRGPCGPPSTPRLPRVTASPSHTQWPIPAVRMSPQLCPITMTGQWARVACGEQPSAAVLGTLRSPPPSHAHPHPFHSQRTPTASLPASALVASVAFTPSAWWVWRGRDLGWGHHPRGPRPQPDGAISCISAPRKGMSPSGAPLSCCVRG